MVDKGLVANEPTKPTFGVKVYGTKEIIPIYLHNKKYVVVEKESDYDNHYVKCFDCAMYNHTFKECLRSIGFKIPDCEADQRKVGKSVIFVEDRG